MNLRYYVKNVQLLKKIKNDTDHPDQLNNAKYVKYTLIVMNPDQEEVLYVEAYAMIQHKCSRVADKRFEKNGDDVYESDPDDNSTIGILRPTTILKGYENDLYINVKKYMNNEFEEKPWIEPEQMNQVIDTVNELIPKSIPTEIMNQITDQVIEENNKNVKLFF